MSSLQHTEDQRRAQRAWERIHEVEKNKTIAGKYRALVRSAAGDILTNGLGQTLAFLLAKDKGKHEGEHWELFCHLDEWLANPDEILDKPRYEKGKLMEWVVKIESDTYRRAAFEAITYLNWLKRFAEATLPEPPSDSDRPRVSQPAQER